MVLMKVQAGQGHVDGWVCGGGVGVARDEVVGCAGANFALVSLDSRLACCARRRFGEIGSGASVVRRPLGLS